MSETESDNADESEYLFDDESSCDESAEEWLELSSNESSQNTDQKRALLFETWYALSDSDSDSDLEETSLGRRIAKWCEEEEVLYFGTLIKSPDPEQGEFCFRVIYDDRDSGEDVSHYQLRLLLDTYEQNKRADPKRNKYASVKWGKFSNDNAKKARDCISDVLEETFKGVYWYERAKENGAPLNKQTGGDEGTVTVSSCLGLWMTKETQLHKDHNNALGPSFVLTTCSPTGQIVEETTR